MEPVSDVVIVPSNDINWSDRTMETNSEPVDLSTSPDNQNDSIQQVIAI